MRSKADDMASLV